jgi:NitT/TauT family transport system substrate-binding protein
MSTFIRSGLTLLMALAAQGAAIAETPRAHGETVNIQHYAGIPGNMHAVIARAKGFCEKYNFSCELKNLNSTALGIQALVGGVVDVAEGAPVQLMAANAGGGDIVVIGTGTPNNLLALTVRNDLVLPHRNEGYPAVMKDFKGKKIGVAARGTEAELLLNSMLIEGGLQPSDISAIGLGGHATAYTSLVLSKQIDAAVVVDPLMLLCDLNKTCQVVVDMRAGEGPAAVKKMNGAAVTLSMRRDYADKNPELVAAFLAAMKDAAQWFNDPSNFEELVKIYTPLISFGDMPDGDKLMRATLKSAVARYSKDLAVSPSSLQATADFYAQATILPPGIKTDQMIWSKAARKSGL